MRKTETVTITAEGRDKGKRFALTEMPATQAEKWALRAFMALAKSGLEIPDDVQNMGMAGIAALGFQALAGISFQDAEPLLDEMMACVQCVPSAGVVRVLIEDDIEEVATRFTLRRDVFELHTGFFSRAAPSTSIPAKTRAARSETT